MLSLVTLSWHSCILFLICRSWWEKLGLQCHWQLQVASRFHKFLRWWCSSQRERYYWCGHQCLGQTDEVLSQRQWSRNGIRQSTSRRCVLPHNFTGVTCCSENQHCQHAIFVSIICYSCVCYGTLTSVSTHFFSHAVPEGFLSLDSSTSDSWAHVDFWTVPIPVTYSYFSLLRIFRQWYLWHLQFGQRSSGHQSACSSAC